MTTTSIPKFDQLLTRACKQGLAEVVKYLLEWCDKQIIPEFSKNNYFGVVVSNGHLKATHRILDFFKLVQSQLKLESKHDLNVLDTIRQQVWQNLELAIRLNRKPVINAILKRRSLFETQYLARHNQDLVKMAQNNGHFKLAGWLKRQDYPEATSTTIDPTHSTAKQCCVCSKETLDPIQIQVSYCCKVNDIKVQSGIYKRYLCSPKCNLDFDRSNCLDDPKRCNLCSRNVSFHESADYFHINKHVVSSTTGYNVTSAFCGRECFKTGMYQLKTNQAAESVKRCTYCDAVVKNKFIKSDQDYFCNQECCGAYNLNGDCKKYPIKSKDDLDQELDMMTGKTKV